MWPVTGDGAMVKAAVGERAAAEAFVAAGHQRLEYCRMASEIVVDGEKWLVGFVQGAPRKAAQNA